MNPTHPAERFAAPGSIQPGVPLKNILDQRLVALIAESLAAVHPRFDLRRFTAAATNGLATLELKARARHIADAMQAHLPADFKIAAPLLLKSFGPELQTTENYGLSPFFYMPHSELISRYAKSHFDEGMSLNYALTKCYTSEFSIRPYIVAQRAQSLRLLNEWTRDANPHVRRLASEGSRPRLPWGMRLRELDANPQLALPLLDRLKDDSVLYVRRSVANHLGDIGKAHLPALLGACQRWLEESQRMPDPQAAKNRRWIIRHALRHPAKKGHPEALTLRRAAS